MDRLVLWDIDGTLVTTPGVGHGMYAAAFRAVVGREPEHLPDMGGRTDHDLVATTLALHGVVGTGQLVADFYRELIVAADRLRGEMLSRGSALAGAMAAVDALAGVPGLVQSVVTGNLRPVAYQKLSVFGLDAHIDFEIGGYGIDDGVRSTLVRLALERAARGRLRTFAPGNVVVIGDTAHDIKGAHDNGVIAIGVATGRTSFADLVAAGADTVLTSLADTDAVVRAVLRDPVAVSGGGIGERV